MLKFVKNNRGLTVGVVLAFAVFVSYEFTMDWPEIIPYGDFIYNLGSQLSLAYMGSFIFYIIQVYIPEERNKKSIDKALRERLMHIAELMIDPIHQICKECLDEEFKVENITEEQWKIIGNTINFNKKVSMSWTNLESVSCLEAILTNIKCVDEKIDRIYMSLGKYLDIEILTLLEDITISSYHLCFPTFGDDMENAIYIRILKEYSELYNRLIKYINQGI